MNLSSIRKTAAQITAAAVFESFPNVQLLGGCDTSSGFYYDFYFPHLVHPELHFQIEERMRQIVREKRPIKHLEMVPFSARAFLKSKGHEMMAEQLEGEGLVQLVQIGNFAALADGEHAADLPAFKIFPPVIVEENVMRISGAADVSKDALKDFLKKWAIYPKVRHERVGAAQKLWKQVDDSFIWLPGGLLRREALLAQFKELLAAGSMEISCPEGVDRISLYRSMGVERVSETIHFQDGAGEDGLLNPREGTELRIAFAEENMISFLQIIGKTLNILGFNYSLCLMGPKRKDRGVQALEKGLSGLGWDFTVSIAEGVAPQINFLVEDAIGRQWSAVTLEASTMLLVRVIVERNIALLVERLESRVNMAGQPEKLNRI